MKHALVLVPGTVQAREALITAGEGRCEFVFKDPNWSREEYCAALRKAEILLGEPRNEDFVYCENLKWMQSPSSGVNYYVQGGCFPKSAMLSCMTGAYGNIIAEHMLAMILSLCRRLPDYYGQQQRHIWKWLRYDKQLEDCNLLILGAGDIGTTLAAWMRPMVKKVVGLRRTQREFPDCYDEMVTLEALDEVLGQADIVACALPHTPQTVGLLNEDRLRKMKKDAILVNAGRGSLIDQEALCRCLDEGWFYGVGLEVTTPEPLPESHPLWQQPRVIITPHAAGNTFGPGSALDKKIWNFMTENTVRYLRGETPENLVDFQTGYRKTV